MNLEYMLTEIVERSDGGYVIRSPVPKNMLKFVVEAYKAAGANDIRCLALNVEDYAIDINPKYMVSFSGNISMRILRERICN